MIIYLESPRRQIIVQDDNGQKHVVEIDEARRRFEAGEFEDWSLSFQTFARLNYDWDALEEYYRD